MTRWIGNHVLDIPSILEVTVPGIASRITDRLDRCDFEIPRRLKKYLPSSLWDMYESIKDRVNEGKCRTKTKGHPSDSFQRPAKSLMSQVIYVDRIRDKQEDDNQESRTS